MKKKLQKKISLTRETLRDLSGHEAREVAGGFTHLCCNSSDPSVDTCTGASCNCSARCSALTAC
jgi:hypothetical protein